jgi:hypothetical protein
MRQLRRRKVIVGLIAASVLFIPLTAHAFFGTMPVIDWTAVTRIGHQIGFHRKH